MGSCIVLPSGSKNSELVKVYNYSVKNHLSLPPLSLPLFLGYSISNRTVYSNATLYIIDQYFSNINLSNWHCTSKRKQSYLYHLLDATECTCIIFIFITRMVVGPAWLMFTCCLRKVYHYCLQCWIVSLRSWKTIKGYLHSIMAWRSVSLWLSKNSIHLCTCNYCVISITYSLPLNPPFADDKS